MGASRKWGAVIAVSCLALFVPNGARAQQVTDEKRVTVCVDADTCLDTIAFEDPIEGPITPALLVCETYIQSNPDGTRLSLPSGLGEIAICDPEDDHSYIAPHATIVALDGPDGELLSFREKQYLSHGNRFWNSDSTIALGEATIKIESRPVTGFP